MQSQLALALDESYDEGAAGGRLGGRPGAGSGVGEALTVRRARSRRSGGFSVLSQRTRRIGRQGVARARAKLAELPASPDADLDPWRGAA